MLDKFALFYHCKNSINITTSSLKWKVFVNIQLHGLSYSGYSEISVSNQLSVTETSKANNK